MARTKSVYLLACVLVLCTGVATSANVRLSDESAEPGILNTDSLMSSTSHQFRYFRPYNCYGMRYRRDIRDMSRWQVRRFRRAILRMHSDKGKDGKSEWDRLVEMHDKYSREAHGGCYFLPWHRLFILRLENTLRRYAYGVTLPFWDWSRDNTDPAMSTVWSPRNVGGALRTNQPIKDGPFKNMSVAHPTPHKVARDFNSGVSRDMFELVSWPALQQVLAEKNWGDFALGTEYAHNLPHVAVGGDMSGIATSPNDPVFYLHHTYIDYLYELRQKKNGTTEFGGEHDLGNGPEKCKPEQILKAFNLEARRGFVARCVRYIPTRTKGVNGGVTLPKPKRDRRQFAPATFTRRRPVPNICETPALLRKSGMSLSSCRKARKILKM